MRLPIYLCRHRAAGGAGRGGGEAGWLAEGVGVLLLGEWVGWDLRC